MTHNNLEEELKIFNNDIMEKVSSRSESKKYDVDNTIIFLPNDKETTQKTLVDYKKNIDSSIIHVDNGTQLSVHFYKKIMHSKLPISVKKPVKKNNDDDIKQLLTKYITGLENINNTIQEINKTNRFKSQIKQNELNTKYSGGKNDAYINSTFISSLNHHIKTFLNCFVISVQLLDDILKEEEHRRILNHLLSSCVDMSKYLGSITDYYMLTQDKITYKYENYNILENVTMLRNIFKTSISAHKINFVIKTLNNVSSKIMIDKKRLNQVLAKIIENSIRYTIDGDIIVLIGMYDNVDNCIDDDGNKTNIDDNIKKLINSVIRKYTNGKLLKIIVQDTGPGIPKNELDNVVKPFYQIDNTINSTRSGLGLGLTICYGFINGMNGNMNIDSSDTGTKITILLPVYLNSKKDDTPNEKIDNLNDNIVDNDLLEKMNKGKKILVVDDDERNNMLLKLMIEQILYKAHVDAVSDPNIVVDTIVKNDYDYVFLDIKMPDISGFDILKILDTQYFDTMEKIPNIILITALSDNDIQDDVTQINSVANIKIIYKPIRFNTIQNVF